MKVRKAIIPAAGLGTRMLPATKAVPKEMLIIVDKPVIQHVVEHAVSSGIEEILIVLSKGKEAIKNHFDMDPNLVSSLEDKGKLYLLDSIKTISGKVKIDYAYQKEQKGLGDAVLCARDFSREEPVAILLGDSIVVSDSKKPILKQMIDLFQEKQSSTVAITEVERKFVSRYGVMDGHTMDNSSIFKIRDWVEKPSISSAPSNMVVSGLYIFTPLIFDMLVGLPKGTGDEIQLTDAMRLLLQVEDMYGFRFQGKRYDIGNRIDFIKTNLTLGLQDQTIDTELSQWVKSL